MVSHDSSATTQRQQPSKLLYIHIFVNNAKTRTMIDTGSTISAINTSYWNTIKDNQHIHPITTTCRMTNNSQLHISGMVVLPITINNINTEINVFVIDDLCIDLLLGADFCDKYNVNISYGGKYLTISTRQQQTRVKFQQLPNTQQVFHVKTLNDIAIPPLSSKVIQAASSSPPMSTIFTPSSRMTNKQHVIAPHPILTI
ncbi:unnamed protein product, partial [Didymodactylos carnosus]